MGTRESGIDRGVTPVVGIVLLIAITLLLASTVAVFAVGLGEEGQQPAVPTTAFEFAYDPVPGADDTLRIVHKSGDTLDVSTLEVVLEDASCTGSDPNGRYDAAAFGASGRLSAGETLTVDGSTTCSAGGDLDLSRATLRVVWIHDEETSAVLQTWKEPG